MRRVLLLVLSALTGCASAPVWAAPPQGSQSLDYVLRLIGRHAAGHACPVEPRLALTSAHVIDLRPFDRDVPLSPYGWSDAWGSSGWVVPVSVETARDVGRMEPLGPSDTFPHVLPVAVNAPTPGTRVWLLGYRFDSPKTALADERIEAHVTRVIANHVFYQPAGHPGSSGSCVLNDAGEVVGINEGAFTTDEHEGAGFAVGVWSSLLSVPK